MKTSMTIVLFFSLSPTANCPCKCDGKSLKSVNKLPNMKGSLQLKNGWLELSTGLGGLISLQNGREPATLKTLESFS